mgnify:CR=1 FL=1
MQREVRSALDLKPVAPGEWRAPIVTTVASSGEGVAGLAKRVADHREHLAARGLLEGARRRRVRAEVMALLGAQLRRAWEDRQEQAVTDILEGRSTPAAEVSQAVLIASTSSSDFTRRTLQMAGDASTSFSPGISLRICSN